MKPKILSVIISALILFVMQSCSQRPTCHEEMVDILKRFNVTSNEPKNQWYPQAGLGYMDSLLTLPHSTASQIRYCQYLKANLLLQLGQEDEAIGIFESLALDDSAYQREVVWKDLAVAYLRQGERMNCITNHGAESCILPIKGMAIHSDPTGSTKAIEIYKKLLAKHPDDLESKWLLNLAYMTLGEYPKGVPKRLYIPGLEGDTTYKVNAF